MEERQVYLLKLWRGEDDQVWSELREPGGEPHVLIGTGELSKHLEALIPPLTPSQSEEET